MAGSAWASKPRTLRDGTTVRSVYYRRGGRASPARTYRTVEEALVETVLGEVRALLTLGIDPEEAKRRAAGLPTASPSETAPPPVQVPAVPYTFGAWLEEFKPMYLRYRRAGAKHKTTVMAYIQAQYQPRFGHLPCLLPFQEVQRWMDELAASGHSRHTIRNYFGVLNTILTWAVNHGKIDRNPLQNRAGTGPIEQLKPERPRQRRVWLSHAQFRALIAASPDRFKAFFVVMTMCGLRVEEAIGLRWRDVLLDHPLDGGGDGVVNGPGALLVRKALSNPTRRKADRRLKDTKTGEARAVGLGQVERDWLAWHREYFGGGPDDFVFWSPGNGTQACQGKRFTLDDARFGRVWRSIRKRAGLEAGAPCGPGWCRSLLRPWRTGRSAGPTSGSEPPWMARRSGPVALASGAPRRG